MFIIAVCFIFFFFKGMFLFTIYKFFSYNYIREGMGKGSNKVLYKEALAQNQNLVYFYIVFSTGKASLSYRWSLKPLSQTYYGPTRFHFLDK